ncbi:MAG: MBL fold metallo-hydrolase [Gemmatimonadales bacterium]|nr:MBL fold metallo-hydrolase [Gemmatimonadales bacterium]
MPWFVLLLTGSALLACSDPGLASGTLTITCLNVGQGDATLIESPSGMTLLFDGGDNGKGNGIVLPYLQSQGITSLDYMVASHYHADHIGGLDEVYNGIPINEAVLDRGWSYGSSTITYNSYASTVASQRQTLTHGQVIDLGEGVTVTCIALNGNGEVPSPFTNSSYENEYDVCLLIQYGGFDFFAAGDLTGGGLSYGDIETGVAPLAGDLDIYRVNHHGSDSSSNAGFMQTVQAEVSIISVGATNSYGHPTQNVLDRLVYYGSFVYQTESGTGGTLPPEDLTVVGDHIVITTNGITEYTVDGDVWAIDEDSGTPVVEIRPRAFSLAGNHPNPFNPTTEIMFYSEQGGSGLLRIFDVSGKSILDRGFQAESGSNKLSWRGTDNRGRIVPGGVYLYSVSTPDGKGQGRMLLLK